MSTAKRLLRSDPKLFFAIDVTLEMDERRKRKTTSVDPSFLMFGAAPTQAPGKMQSTLDNDYELAQLSPCLPLKGYLFLVVDFSVDTHKSVLGFAGSAKRRSSGWSSPSRRTTPRSARNSGGETRTLHGVGGQTYPSQNPRRFMILNLVECEFETAGRCPPTKVFENFR